MLALEYFDSKIILKPGLPDRWFSRPIGLASFVAGWTFTVGRVCNFWAGLGFSVFFNVILKALFTSKTNFFQNRTYRKEQLNTFESNTTLHPHVVCMLLGIHHYL